MKEPRLVIRATPDVLKKIKKAAKDAGLPASSWARAVLVAALKG